MFLIFFRPLSLGFGVRDHDSSACVGEPSEESDMVAASEKDSPGSESLWLGGSMQGSWLRGSIRV